MTDENELMPEVADDHNERKIKTRKYEHGVDRDKPKKPVARIFPNDYFERYEERQAWIDYWKRLERLKLIPSDSLGFVSFILYVCSKSKKND